MVGGTQICMRMWLGPPQATSEEVEQNILPTHPPSSIVICDVARSTLGAVDDDHAPLTGIFELLQEVGACVRDVACPEGLQNHPLHRGLQEGAHLGGGAGKCRALVCSYAYNNYRASLV